MSVDEHRIATEAELGAVMGEPAALVRAKVLDHLDRHCHDVIARSPFVLLATASAGGLLDVSPRGGRAGFVEVSEDGARLVFADAKGNRLADSLHNIVATGRAGLLFLVPGLGETLRVNGRAHLTRDPALLARHVVEAGKPPRLAVVVDVEEAFLHCAKALIRSALWQPDTWPDLHGLATPAQIWKDHAAAPLTVAELQADLDDAYVNDLNWEPA